MSNSFGAYQNAFSMFLASHTDESPKTSHTDESPKTSHTDESPKSDSQGLVSDDNSQDNLSHGASLHHDTTLTSAHSSSNMSQLHTVASTDSLSEQIRHPFVPELPPPSEDANLEPVGSMGGDEILGRDLAEESVDDTPHFHAVLDESRDSDSNSFLAAEVMLAGVNTEGPSPPLSLQDDDSQSSPHFQSQQIDTDTSILKTSNLQPVLPEEPEKEKSAAEVVFEYQWPQETGGDIFMIQEQLSEFLDILSFKRKYPDLTRRAAEYKERIFLIDNRAVTDQQCDLGLTILRSEEVYELMSKDYPVKYKEYVEVLRERERKRVIQAAKNYAGMQAVEKNKMDYILKKAVRSAAEFNAQFMREKREERRAYMDLQTLEVHYPRNMIKVVPKELTTPGSYPVALIPGQFQDYYKNYTPQELKYYPIKTALYSPHKVLKSIYADPNDGVQEAKSTEDDEKEKEESSSSSDESGSGSSDSEPDSIEGETNEVKISEEQIKKLLATPRPDTPPKKARRKLVQNGTDTNNSEKDSETGSVKGSKKQSVKTPGKKTFKPGKGRPKGRPPLLQNLQCNICQETGLKDKDGEYLDMAQCSDCCKFGHISCIELTDEMLPVIKTYPWQCMECKTCNKCKDAQDEENMMFCDHCDRGYHTFCVGVKEIPPGRWDCPMCLPHSHITSNDDGDETPIKKMKLN